MASYLGTDVVVKRLNAAASPEAEEARSLARTANNINMCFVRHTQAFASEVAILFAACQHPHLIGYLGVTRHVRELW